ncbi:sporulation protein [Bacillus massilinigeriensis]|uniref:sporulation protein n=1 Tax=Bacillus mediterraneensis TaxID=1805474 RepID=UPI0008F911E4|nr:sporulation protein [Bacillus mediterraneensis]
MDKTLAYLRETIANYTEKDPIAERIYSKIESGINQSEEHFIRRLTLKEERYLNKILAWEIQYAKNEMDETRAKQLNEVYELLL